MSFRRSRGYRVIMLALSVACLGGAGYLGYRTFFATPSVDRSIKAAETAYQRGVAAYNEKKWADAATHFDEANLLANKAKEALERRVWMGSCRWTTPNPPSAKSCGSKPEQSGIRPTPRPRRVATHSPNRWILTPKKPTAHSG